MLLQPRYKLTEGEGSANRDDIVSRLKPLDLIEAIQTARDAIIRQQQPDGHNLKKKLRLTCAITRMNMMAGHCTTAAALT